MKYCILSIFNIIHKCRIRSQAFDVYYVLADFLTKSALSRYPSRFGSNWLCLMQPIIDCMLIKCRKCCGTSRYSIIWEI